MGTEISRLGGYSFRGTITAGDGANQKGENWSRFCEPARKKKRQQKKSGRKEEGSSSNRPSVLPAGLVIL